MLAAIQTTEALSGSLYVGSSWDGYVIQQVVASLGYDVQPYYYRTADGSGLDLLLVRGGQPVVGIEIELDLLLVKGVKPVVALEIRYSNVPNLTRGNTQAIMDLGLEQTLMVTPEADSYWLRKDVRVCSITNVWEVLAQLGVLA